MNRLAKLAGDFLKKEEGPTAVEYAVMLGLIVMVCIAAISLVGTQASSSFNSPKVINALGAGS